MDEDEDVVHRFQMLEELGSEYQLMIRLNYRLGRSEIQRSNVHL